MNESQSSGFRSIQWNGKNSNNDKVSSGIYFYSIQSGEFQATKNDIAWLINDLNFIKIESFFQLVYLLWGVWDMNLKFGETIQSKTPLL